MRNLERREFIRRIGYTFMGIFLLLNLKNCIPNAQKKKIILDTKKGRSKKIVIIGSGITGLCIGALLSRVGHKVTVLEAHHHLLGGHCRTVDIQGLKFCVGPQYVWNFGKGQIGNRILKFLGLDKDIRFLSMSKNGFERFHVGNGKGIDIPIGLDRFQQTMVDSFPKQKEALKKFFSYLYDLYQGAKIINNRALYLEGKKVIKRAIFFSTHLSLRKKIRINRCSDWSLADLFDFCGIKDELRRILYGHGGIFAESESDVSAIAYAGATGFYHSGAFYPESGFHGMVEKLCAFISLAGGEVLTNSEVTDFTIIRGEMKTVICADGRSYDCDLVISSVAPRVLCKLIDQCDTGIFTYEPSFCFITCLVGLDRYPGMLNLKGKNLWWQSEDCQFEFTQPDMLESPKMLYVGSPSANGIQGSNREPQSDSLIIFAPGNFKQSLKYGEMDLKNRTAFKESIANLIIESVEQYLMPDLRAHIKFVKVLTPYDTFRAIQSERGNAYGRRMTAESLSAKVREVPEIHNLYFGCATVGAPGVATAFSTAAYLFKKITGIGI